MYERSHEHRLFHLGPKYFLHYFMPTYCRIVHDFRLPSHNTTLYSKGYLFTGTIANCLHNFQCHVTNPYVFRSGFTFNVVKAYVQTALLYSHNNQNYFILWPKRNMYVVPISCKKKKNMVGREIILFCLTFYKENSDKI